MYNRNHEAKIKSFTLKNFLLVEILCRVSIGFGWGSLKNMHVFPYYFLLKFMLNYTEPDFHIIKKIKKISKKQHHYKQIICAFIYIYIYIYICINIVKITII